MQNNGYIWGAVIAVLIIIGGYFIFHNPQTAPTSGTATTTPYTLGSTTTTNLGNGVTVVANGPVAGGITVTTNKSVPAPSLTRATTFSSTLSPEQVSQLQSDEKATIATLTQNPTQPSYWLQLAEDYKIAGDYQGAIDIWTYLTKVTPPDYYVPYADLGDLYQNFDINYPKAETNLLEAVKLKPDDISLYGELFDLYTNSYKINQGKANSIIAQGLKANPGNADLLQLQSQLKSSTQ